MLNILDLRLANGPGWWVGAERCLTLDLKLPRSNLWSKTVITVVSLGVQLNRDTRPHPIVGYEAYTYRVCCIKKYRYFFHISHNPMFSGPKDATSWWDSVVYTSRIVINLIWDPKMRSPLALGNTDVIFSVHGDYIWVRVPRGTLSVGSEQ